MMHGGATITTNVHGIDSTEAYAIDLICVDEDGQFFKNGGMALTDVLGYQKIIVSHLQNWLYIINTSSYFTNYFFTD